MLRPHPPGARLMKRLPVLLAVTVAAAACARRTLTDQLARATWVDLTYAFDSTTIYWPTAKPFRLEVVSAQRTPAGRSEERRVGKECRESGCGEPGERSMVTCCDERQYGL